MVRQWHPGKCVCEVVRDKGAACRFVFENYSKEWFGLGIVDYEGGKHAADIIQGIADTFAIVGSKEKTHEPQEKAKAILIPYLHAAIDAVSL